MSAFQDQAFPGPAGCRCLECSAPKCFLPELANCLCPDCPVAECCFNPQFDHAAAEAAADEYLASLPATPRWKQALRRFKGLARWSDLCWIAAIAGAHASFFNLYEELHPEFHAGLDSAFTWLILLLNSSLYALPVIAGRAFLLWRERRLDSFIFDTTPTTIQSKEQSHERNHR